jgi:hypothetical protein
MGRVVLMCGLNCISIGNASKYELYLNIQYLPHRKHTKPNRLMLFRETVAVYCENHTELTNTLPNNIVQYFGLLDQF